MAIEPKQVLYNALAGFTPVRNQLRRIRDRSRPPDYAGIVNYTLKRLQVRREFIGDDGIRGASLLEIGSGQEFGLGLLLVAFGARRVVNVEIEPYGFISDPALYRLLVEKARAEGLEIRWPPAGLQVSSNGRSVRPDPEKIVLHLGCSAETIPEPDCSFDATFSVAVLEHIRGGAMPRVAREPYRLTRPGGAGYHRVDLVDHYTRAVDPLRFLRYSPRQYDLMFGNRGSSLNRMRMDDHVKRTKAAKVRYQFNSMPSRTALPREDTTPPEDG